MPFFSYCANSMDMLVPRGHASVTFSESHVVFWYVLNVPDSKAAERNNKRKKKLLYVLFTLGKRKPSVTTASLNFCFVWDVLPTQIEISREVFFLSFIGSIDMLFKFYKSIPNVQIHISSSYCRRRSGPHHSAKHNTNLYCTFIEQNVLFEQLVRWHLKHATFSMQWTPSVFTSSDRRAFANQMNGWPVDDRCRLTIIKKRRKNSKDKSRNDQSWL